MTLQATADVKAIEISALRERELIGVISAVPRLDLTQYEYVSMHVPSELHDMTELELVGELMRLDFAAAFVVHPNIIRNFDVWHQLGDRLCIENMDQRKPVGRTMAELRRFAAEFELAGFCLDLGHAHQIDPTMGVAIEILDALGSRLRHLHVSEVNPHGRHLPIGYTARYAFERIASLIPSDMPIIIESVICPDAIATELEVVRDIFAVARLRKAS